MEIILKVGLLVGACVILWMIAISRVHVEVLYTWTDDDDLFRLKLRALFGLIRYKLEIPIINWNSMQKSVTFMRESMNVNMQDVIGKGKGEIDRHAVIRQFEQLQELLKHTLGLHAWLLRTLRQIQCSGLEWTTEVGIGDAPDTAITAGLVWGIQSSILGFVFRYIRLQQMPVVSVQPLFNQYKLDTRISGHFYVRLNTVVAAVFQLLRRIVRTRKGLRGWRRVFQRV